MTKKYAIEIEDVPFYVKNNDSILINAYKIKGTNIVFTEEQMEELLEHSQSLDPPKTNKEQYNSECPFCSNHEAGDTLYEYSSWDGGIGFDYIRDIRFCPICGRALYNEE